MGLTVVATVQGPAYTAVADTAIVLVLLGQYVHIVAHDRRALGAVKTQIVRTHVSQHQYLGLACKVSSLMDSGRKDRFCQRPDAVCHALKCRQQQRCVPEH